MTSMRALPRVRRALLPALMLGVALAGCKGCDVEDEPVTLTLVSPKAGARFNRADDLVPDREGVQLEAVVEADKDVLDGMTATLTATPASAVSDVRAAALSGRTARVTFTLAGDASIVAMVDRGPDSDPVQSPAVAVTFDPAPAACRFVDPADGAVLAAADDGVPALPGFQRDVRVRCAGVELGNPVELSVLGAPVATAPLGAGGVVVFPKVQLAEGENTLAAATATNAGAEVGASARVTVSTGACRLVISPPGGTVFNARGEGGEGHVADRTLGAPMDARLSVEAGCPGALVHLERGEEEIASQTAGSGPLQFDVQLSDGTAEIRARASGTATGFSPVVRYLVDARVPAGTIEFPPADAQLSESDDVGAEPGLQIRVRGKFTNADAGRPVRVVLDTGAEQEQALEAVLGAQGDFAVVATVGAGEHTVVASLTLASGTTAKTATTSFRAGFEQHLSILEPGDGTVLNRAADAGAEPGHQVRFSLLSGGLPGATVRVVCGAASGTGQLSADGFGQITLTLAPTGCGPEPFVCHAETGAGDGLVRSGDVRLVLDTVAPTVELVAPANGAILGASAVTFRATTGCPGEAQSASLLLGTGMLAGPDAITDNAVTFADVTVPEGENVLELVVADAAGNEGSVSVSFTVDTVMPAVVFVDPPATGDVTWNPEDNQGTDAADFRRTITVAVDNKRAGIAVGLFLDALAAPVGSAVTTQVDARRLATFPLTSLPKGAHVLKACAVDDANKTACAERPVLVRTLVPDCSFQSPADGAAFGLAAQVPPAPGVKIQAVVATDAPGGSTVVLTKVAPDGTRTEVSGLADGSTDAADRTATFSALALDAEGAWTLEARCTGEGGLSASAAPVQVTVDTVRPDASIPEPVEAQVFNALSPDRGTEAGFQIDVAVESTDLAAGNVASLTVSCGLGPTTLPEQPLVEGRAVFAAVTVPDIADCTLSATVEDAAGNASAAAVRHFRVKRTPPTVAFDTPDDGTLYGGARDAAPATAGFQLDLVRVHLTLAPGASTAVLSLNGSEVGAATLSGSGPGQRTAQWTMLTLQEGANTLLVTATDDVGNPATASIVVTVDTLGPQVNIGSHVSGPVPMRSDVDTAMAGMQQNFSLTGQQLVNGTTVRICSPQAAADAPACAGPSGGLSPVSGRILASAVLGGGGAVLPKVTLPEGVVVVYAEALDPANNRAGSTPLTLTVDSVPPTVETLQILRFAAGSETELSTAGGSAVFGTPLNSGAGPGFLVRLRAKVSDTPPGALKATAAFIDSNPVPGTVLKTVAIAADGSISADVTLPEGGHRIHVAVVDAVDNPNSTPSAPLPGYAFQALNFAVDLTPPQLGLVQPQPGTLLAAQDAATDAGMQTDVVVDSDAGAEANVSIFLGNPPPAGAPLATATLPLTGRRATARVTLPEGALTLYATVADGAGNVRTTATTAVLVDSVAPVVAITGPAEGATDLVDADANADNGFQLAQVTVAYAQADAGQPIVLLSSKGGTLATQPAAAADGTATFANVTVPAGAQALTARARDASGNQTTSAAVNLVVNAGVPAVGFASPANPLVFGRGTMQGDSCVVSIGAWCDTDGSTVTLLQNGVAGPTATVAAGAATLANVTIAGGATVTLQLKAVDAASRTGWSAPRTATCRLTTPQVRFLDPAAGSTTKYVAFGNPGGVAGARANKFAVPALVADFAVEATGVAGGTVKLSSSLDGDVGLQNVTTDAATTVSFPSTSLASKGEHALTATVVDVAGNTASTAITLQVDVQAPAPCDAAAGIADGRKTRIKLSFSAPGDDGAGGGPVASYVVKRADAPIGSEAAWTSATAVPDPVVAAIAAPGEVQELLVEGLPFEKSYHFAVRALDAAGNLGPLGTASLADLRLARQHLVVPVGSNFGQVRIAVADLDKDGYDDLVTSSSSAAGNNGQVSIHYGAPVPGGAVVLTGDGPVHLGSALATGDVNGDGVTDLVVGAEYAHAPDGATETTKDGALYVYLGRAGTRFTSATAPDSRIYGKLSGPDLAVLYGVGNEIAVVGDLNGDGRADIVAGSSQEAAKAGKVYVVAGRESWPATLSLATDSLATLTCAFAATGGPFFGVRVGALGDLNADGAADFAVSAAFGTLAATDGQGEARRIYVVSGLLARGAVVADTVSAVVRPVLPPAPPALPLYAAGSRFGFDLATADATGDGLRDLLVGDSNDGKNHLFDGALVGAAIPAAAVAAAPDATRARLAVLPLNSGGMTMRGLGDITGDGVEDFAVSRVQAPSPDNNVHLWFGRAATAWQSPWPPADPPAATPSVASSLIVGPEGLAATFGVRVAAGNFLSRAPAAPDIIVLNLGGDATVLSGP